MDNSGAPKKKSVEQRKALLAQAIQSQVISGARIESQSEFQSVLVEGHKVNHLLHFIVGLFTFGFWWLVWVVIVIVGGEKRKIVSIDEYGNVLIQRA